MTNTNCIACLPPKHGGVFPPEKGWKPCTYYTVRAAFRKGNPVHNAIFYSGFLSEGKPAGYNCLFNPTYDRNYEIHEVFFLEVIKEINF